MPDDDWQRADSAANYAEAYRVLREGLIEDALRALEMEMMGERDGAAEEV